MAPMMLLVMIEAIGNEQTIFRTVTLNQSERSEAFSQLRKGA